MVVRPSPSFHSYVVLAPREATLGTLRKLLISRGNVVLPSWVWFNRMSVERIWRRSLSTAKKQNRALRQTPSKMEKVQFTGRRNGKECVLSLSENHLPLSAWRQWRTQSCGDHVREELIKQPVFVFTFNEVLITEKTCYLSFDLPLQQGAEIIPATRGSHFMQVWLVSAEKDVTVGVNRCGRNLYPPDRWFYASPRSPPPEKNR